LAFHAELKGFVQPVLDRARIRVQAFRRTWGTGRGKRAMIRTDKPLLIFEPGYAKHFYEFLELASDFEAVARFTRCPRCDRFFLARKNGTKFCSVAHSAEFHNRQPGRKSKVKDAVERHRIKKMRHQRAQALRQFARNAKPEKYGWRSAMEGWNQNCGRKRTWKFASVEEFRRECEWVLGKQA